MLLKQVNSQFSPGYELEKMCTQRLTNVFFPSFVELCVKKFNIHVIVMFELVEKDLLIIECVAIT